MHYQLFGGVLRSDVEFPELAGASTGAAAWVLRSVEGDPPDANGERLGVDAVNPKVEVTLYRQADGFRLAFNDTGAFDIGDGGRAITWYHPAGVDIANARADLTSRVLAVALHAAGTLSLHGSAVAIDGSAIGLIAPKRHGKSTLSLALVGAGARLLTDDTLPADAGPPPMARPGLHATRLHADSAARVGLGDASTARQGEKQVFSAMPEAKLMHEPCPLSAIYLLSPSRDDMNGQAAWRTPLSSMESALVMVGHAKLAVLLAGTEAPVLFERAVALARQVPVYRLSVVRDLERLPEAVSIVQGWHTRTVAEPLASTQ